MSRSADVETASAGSTTLRVIPISKPGAPGFSFAIARSDDEEAAVRANAVAQGLLAGEAMPSQPNPEVWSLIDRINGR